MLKRRLSIFALILLLGISSYMAMGDAKGILTMKIAQETAAAFNSTDAGQIVAYVDKEPVTKMEFLASYIMASNNKAMLEQRNDNTVPPQAVERKDIMLNLLMEYTPSTIALATKLADTAAYNEAVRRGLTKSEAEIKNYIQKVRQSLKDNPSPEIAEIIKVVGEDKYWNILAPKEYKKQLTIGALKGEFLANENNLETGYKKWAQYKYELAKKANLEIVDTSLINSTKDEALKYLNARISLYGN
ncbi:hypothetical protein [Neomoorella thermoacetica]|uniref:Uncharacterized protein n=1 Tax=Neomoorella thermoacetica TaxID=1525 RepID=A0A1J5K6S4_NEOTH|nr:hypothetical protein [Moorella thermoacetica]APC09043.1 hypothetical protein MTJW_18910 [Moorella thermoacetica]OIQ09443.1 hypothetical protein MOOR_08210 [Moorella thermoacetica]OIQ12431.1 hypothetical protein MOOTH_07620 [Moorella thermoacetica]